MVYTMKKVKYLYGSLKKDLAQVYQMPEGQSNMLLRPLSFWGPEQVSGNLQN